MLCPPPPSITMKATARMGCQRSGQWPEAPEQHRSATCLSITFCHGPQNTRRPCQRTTAVSPTLVQPARLHSFCGCCDKHRRAKREIASAPLETTICEETRSVATSLPSHSFPSVPNPAFSAGAATGNQYGS